MSTVNAGEWTDAGERVDPELERSRSNRGNDDKPRLLALCPLDGVMERIGGTRGLFRTFETSSSIGLSG